MSYRRETMVTRRDRGASVPASRPPGRNGEEPDAGSEVAKGSLWDNAHPVVLKDKGGILFKPLGDASAPVLAAEG